MEGNYNVLNNSNSNNRYNSENDSNAMNQSKSACPSILNIKRPNIYTHIN